MSKSFEIEGKLKVIDEVQSFASGFTKREFVVEVEDGKFPQMIKFECIKDKASQLDGLSVGDGVKVQFDIRGNEFKERYYVNLNAWKVTKLGEGGGAPTEEGPPKGSNDAYFDDQPDPEDDIPF